MNKYILKTLLCSALAATMLTSCELDQFPETSLPAEKSWKYVSDATNYHVGILAYLRSASKNSFSRIAKENARLGKEGK